MDYETMPLTEIRKMVISAYERWEKNGAILSPETILLRFDAEGCRNLAKECFDIGLHEHAAEYQQGERTKLMELAARLDLPAPE